MLPDLGSNFRTTVMHCVCGSEICLLAFVSAISRAELKVSKSAEGRQSG